MYRKRYSLNLPQKESTLTLVLGEEKLVLHLSDLSPDTIEWIIYDTSKLTDRIRVAASKAREMVKGITHN